jgi:hypothetical protein
MNKVINPLKQPTKKQSQRSLRSLRSKQTAKLKIAIDKIESQLVKDNIKLVKGGGGSPGNTKLINKNLMKGGEISGDTKQEIINLLKKFAPKVNDLKHDLIMKLIELVVDKNNINDDADLYTRIINLHNDFKEGLYKYEFKLEQWINDEFKNTEILDDLIILDILRKYYILLRVKNDEISDFQSYNFVELPDNIIEQLNTPNMEELRQDIKKYKGIVPQTPPEEPLLILEIELEIRIVAAIAAIPAITAALPDIKEAIDKAEEPKIKEAIEKVSVDAAKKVSVDAAKKAAKEAAEKAIAIYKNIGENDRNQIIKKAEEGAVSAVVAGVFALYEEEATTEALEEERAEAEAEGVDGVDKEVLEKTTKARASLEAVYKIYKDKNIDPSDKQNNSATIDNSSQNKKEDALVIAVAAAAIAEVSASQEQKDRAIAKAIAKAQARAQVKAIAQALSGGKSAPKYKSTGQVVNIMYKKRKYKRTIFVKEKRKTKYCKINNEYILLSKLNVI